MTDPTRSAVLEDVSFESLTGSAYQLYLLHDPALSMTGNDDTGRPARQALVSTDGTNGQRGGRQPGRSARPRAATSARPDGWTDLRVRPRPRRPYAASSPGNVVQTGRVPADRPAGSQTRHRLDRLRRQGAAAVARRSASLDGGFAAARTRVRHGLGRLPRPLKPVPASASGWSTEWKVSAMVLAASEDKTVRGGFVAAPNRAWAWSNSLQYLAVYHAVWSRDLYQIATGLLAIGDDAAANRALDFLWTVQQRADGSFPQNSRLDGTPVFGDLQMDEVAFPIVLAAPARAHRRR